FRAIVRLKAEIAVGERIETTLQQARRYSIRPPVCQRQEVAGGLGHFGGLIPSLPFVASVARLLFIGDDQKLSMQPVANERLMGRALALRNLICMVEGYMVHPPAVDVERLPQVLNAHSATF